MHTNTTLSSTNATPAETKLAIVSVTNHNMMSCAWRQLIDALPSIELPFIAVLCALGQVLYRRPGLPPVHIESVHLIRPKGIAASCADDRQVGQRRTRRGQARIAHLLN